MNKLIVVSAPSLSKLQVKSLGYNHDHCHCHYSGKSEDIPHELRIRIRKPTGYYCAIFEEFRSYNPAFLKKIKGWLTSLLNILYRLIKALKQFINIMNS